MARLKARLDKLEPAIWKHWYDAWASFMDATLDKLDEVADEETIKALAVHIDDKLPLGLDGLEGLDGLNLRAWLAWGKGADTSVWPHYPQSLPVPPREEPGTVEALLGAAADEGIRGHTATYLLLSVLAARVWRQERDEPEAPLS